MDKTRDSPFALLAKENDVMWGGGMPDDITVVALRVINKVDSRAAVSLAPFGPSPSPLPTKRLLIFICLSKNGNLYNTVYFIVVLVLILYTVNIYPQIL